MPELFKTMLARVDELQRSVYSPKRGTEKDPKACDAALDRYNGYWGPWLS